MSDFVNKKSRHIQQLREPTDDEKFVIQSKHLNASHWRVAARFGNTLEIVKKGNCQRRVLLIK